MSSRTLVFGFVAALSAGALLAPIEASARAGGMGMGRVAGSMAASGPRMRPFGHIRPMPRPAPRPVVPRSGPRHVRSSVPPACCRATTSSGRATTSPRVGRHHHRPFDTAFPVAGVTVYSASGSPNYSGWPTYSPVAEAEASRRSYVVPTEYPSGIQGGGDHERSGGRVASRLSLRRRDGPLRNAAARAITVTRCYRGE